MNQGIIMDIEGRYAYVFTNDCQLVKIRKNSSFFIGQQINMRSSDRPVTDRIRQSLQNVPAQAYAMTAAVVLLIAVIALLFISPWKTDPITVYMSLDINPSVELALDANHRVLEVMPLNKEAEEILNHVDLKGLDYDQALKNWVAAIRNIMPDKLDQVLISALFDQEDDKFATSLMALNGYQTSGELAGLNIWVVYSSDYNIRELASDNNLSIGRQLLLSQSLQQNLNWTAATIKDAPLENVLRSIITEGQADLLVPDNHIAENEFNQETIIITETTAKPMKTPTGPVPSANEYVRKLSLSANDNSGIAINWTTAPSGYSFRYCKIMLSENNAEPVFPQNGYLVYFKDPSVTNYLINNTKKYTAHSEDLSRTMVPGRQYYIRVAYVYDDPNSENGDYAVHYSNVITAVYNGPSFTG